MLLCLPASFLTFGKVNPAPLRLTFFWGERGPPHTPPSSFLSAPGPPLRLTFFWEGGERGSNHNPTYTDGSFSAWHCDNERLFGSAGEPKVIVSMSLRHSVLFKLHRRASENTHSQIRLDHGDLPVRDGVPNLSTSKHSTASELSGPRVNLTFRWISQHIESLPTSRLDWRRSIF